MSLNRKIPDWLGLRVWVIGASTGIGAATASQLLALGARVVCSARQRKLLQDQFGNHPSALVAQLDILDHASVLKVRDQILAAMGGIDLVLVVAGGYQPMRADALDLAEAKKLIDLNLGGVFHCLDAALPVLLKQGSGGIGIVASVAGFRGLPKAMVYGPTKAALINLCETMYLDLHARAINVYLINPGFVATPLTNQNDFKMPALISADEAAASLIDGIERGQFHIHFPRRFSNFLRLLRLLPYPLYFWLIHKVTGL